MAELVCGVSGSTGEEIIDEINRQGGLFRGNAWRGDQDYLTGDVVVYADIAYLALVASTNVPPPSTEWQSIAAGVTLDEVGGIPWNGAVTYPIGFMVSENNRAYLSILPSVGVVPSSDPLSWATIETGGGGDYLPLDGSEDMTGSIILSNNISYRARSIGGDAKDIFRVGPTDVLVFNTDQLPAQFQGAILFPNAIPTVDMSTPQGTAANELTRKDYTDTKLPIDGSEDMTGPLTTPTVYSENYIAKRADGTQAFRIQFYEASEKKQFVTFGLDGSTEQTTLIFEDDGNVSVYAGIDEVSTPSVPGNLTRKDYVDAADLLRYLKTDYIVHTTGAADAGKPIVLTSQGQIDPSLVSANAFRPIAPWTPVPGDEYPDTTSSTAGDFWWVTGVVDPYTFVDVGGDLEGRSIRNGDFMVWTLNGWGVMIGEMNPLLYYKLDGTNAITAAFQAGTFQLKNIGDGTDAQDALSFIQFTTDRDVQNTAIGNAQGAADAAQGVADSAQTDATQALADSLAAQTDATQALADSLAAQGTADGAQTAANGAQTTADGAVSVNTTQQTAIDLNTLKVTGSDRVLQSEFDSDKSTQDAAIALNTAKVTGSDRVLAAEGVTSVAGSSGSGTDRITSMVSCTQSEYDLGPKTSGVLYVITT